MLVLERREQRSQVRVGVMPQQLVLHHHGVHELFLQLPLLDLANFVPGDAFTAGIALACGLIYALATASGLYPSWLATRIQPAEALHYE